MKYSLRSLMVAMLVLPPLLSVTWWWFSTPAHYEKAEETYGPGPPGELEKSVVRYEEYLRTHPPQIRPSREP